MPRFSLQSPPLDSSAMLAQLAHPMAGAVVCFEGRCRQQHEGEAVEQLEYEAFVGMAEIEGERIAAEAIEKFGLIDVRIIHLVGTALVGEAAVWVGVTSEHRKEAFQAAAWIMDTVKESLPVWKKESFMQGKSAWIHPISS